MRSSLGEQPYRERNTREKWAGSGSPTDAAMAATGRFEVKGSSSAALALASRARRMRSLRWSSSSSKSFCSERVDRPIAAANDVTDSDGSARLASM